MQSNRKWQNDLSSGNIRVLARLITIVENELNDYLSILKLLPSTNKIPVIGLTGPPGAGKSTLVNALLNELTKQNKRIAVIAVDPSSPFNYGALLGDRIRMAAHYNNPNVYIRSVATRGSLGGLSDKIMEIIDVVKAANFDYIFIETVGVGQSEVEIAGLADTTVVILVPEAGDEIQTMKSGLMEIANIFVVNKADRADSAKFYTNLKKLVHEKPAAEWNIPVLKTISTQQEGIKELLNTIQKHHQINLQDDRRILLLTRKALKLIQQHKMKNIDPIQLKENLIQASSKKNFNLYNYISQNYF